MNDDTDPKRELPHVGQRHGYGAVVFVHGLHGHYRNTWGAFPELLDRDPALPQVDVLLWSYDASAFIGASPLAPEGERLLSGLDIEARGGVTELYLVGHSMGGLVILRGLCDWMAKGHADKPPVTAVRHVTLYASPVQGSQIANWIAWMRKLPRVGWVLGPQIEALQRGEFCDTLIADVVHRLYQPTIQPGDVSTKRAIPVTAVAGEGDWVVSVSSAQSVFRNPPPLVIAGDHSSVKLPVSRTDLAYRALQNVLAGHLSSWFRDRMRDALAGDMTARLELVQRCEHAVRAECATQPSMDARLVVAPEQTVDDVLRVAGTVVERHPSMSFARAIRFAVQMLARRRA